MARQVNYILNLPQQQTTAFTQSGVELLPFLQTTWTFNQFGEVLNLSGSGHAHTFSWEPVAGADKVEITSASVQIGSASIETAEAFNTVSHSDRIDVTIGLGKAVRTLKLNGLAGGNDLNALHNSTDINNNNLKLLVSVADPSGAFTPIYSIPDVSARGVFPRSYIGASFNNDTVSFSTPLQAQTIRLQLVDRGFPEDTASESIEISSVSGTYLSLPVDLAVELDDGTSLFEFPGELPLEASVVQVPLVPSLLNVFQQKLDVDEALESTMTLSATGSSGGNDAMAQVLFANPTGYLLRTESGVHSTELTGEARSLNIPLRTPLADEQPDSAMADISISFAGIKLLPELSADLPAQNGAISGHVVATHKKLKVLPPDALTDKRIARIGIIGRAPEQCELALEIIDMSGGIQGPALLDPVVLQLEADSEIRVHWFEVADQAPINLPLGIALRTNIGRFFWVNETEPLLRLAIYDHDPGTEAVNLGGQSIASGDQLPFTQPSYGLPANLFSQTLPVAASNLFLTIDIADLTLRYAR